MAEAEYWRFTVARDCQKKNTSETHSGYKLVVLAKAPKAAADAATASMSCSITCNPFADLQFACEANPCLGSGVFASMDGDELATEKECPNGLIDVQESYWSDPPPGTKCVAGTNWCCRADVGRIWVGVIILVLVCCVMPAFCCLVLKQDSWWKRRQLAGQRRRLVEQNMQLQQIPASNTGIYNTPS